jgi:hypothetical protein
MLGGQRIGEPAEDVGHLGGKVGVGALPERAGCSLVAAGSAADAQVDAAGEESLEHPELLGDLERAVVLEHDPARPHPDPRGPGRHRPDEDFGAGAGQTRGGVVLGQPVAVVPQPLRVLGQLQSLLDGGRRRGSRANRGLIEYAQEHRLHLRICSPDRTGGMR